MDPKTQTALQQAAAFDPTGEVKAWLAGGAPPKGAMAQQLVNSALQQAGQPPVDFTTPGVAQQFLTGMPGAAGGGQQAPLTDQPPPTLGSAGRSAMTGKPGISSEMDNGVGGGGPQGNAALLAGAQQALSAAGNAVTKPLGGTGSLPGYVPPATGTVNPVLPTTGGGGAGGNLDPSSILGGTLYSKSQEGDASSLDLLLVQTLQNLGLDPFSGSEAVKNVASSIQPYLKLFMEYSGLNDPGAAQDKGKQYADQFANIVSGPGSYGKIRQWGADTLGGAKGLLGKMGQTDAQMNFVNDMLATETAGGNAITNSALHNNAQANQTRFRLNMANDPRVSNYFDWLQKDKTTQGDPMYAQLRSAFQR